jgi:4a-hydroxytetrahydrobiopterin dehydratase
LKGRNLLGQRPAERLTATSAALPSRNDGPQTAAAAAPYYVKKSRWIAIAKRFWGVTRSHGMADLMKPGELKERLKKIPEWELEKKHIERTFEFDDFSDSIDFVNAVAEVAEEEEHHPDIDIRFNKVRLVLSTHSKGGLTELDFALAERIDTLSE